MRAPQPREKAVSRSRQADTARFILHKSFLMLLMAVLVLALSGCSDKKPKIKHSDAPRFQPITQEQLAESKKMGYETPPTFKASEILPPELYRGQHHVIDDLVYNDGIINHYRVNSRYGVYDVASSQMLMQRVSEVEVIGELDEMSRAEVVVGALGDQAKGILLSPVNTVKRLFSIVTKPKKTAKSVAEVPGGIGRFVESARDRTKDAYHTVVDDEEGKPEEQDAQPGAVPVRGAWGQAPPKRPEKDGKVAGFVKDKIGLNDRLAEWQKKLGIDPYSSNMRLHEELKRIVQLETAVGIAFDFVPIGLKVPGMGIVSDINKYHGTVMKVAQFRDPKKLEERNRRALLQMGTTQQMLRRFYNNPWYTPVTQTLITDSLLDMEGANNRGEYIKMATRANSESSALFFARSIRELADLHVEDNRRIVELVPGIFMPAGLTEGGEILVPLAVVDHMCWTRHVAALFNGLLRARNEHYAKAPVTLMVNGTLSDRTKQELNKRRVNWQEHVSFEESAFINPQINLIGIERISAAPVTIERVEEANRRYAPTSIHWSPNPPVRTAPASASW